jgi:release factor glutamine methyltransferase
MTRAREGLQEISSVLRDCGIGDPFKEAEMIFTHCMGMERVVLYRDNPVLSTGQTMDLQMILERRRRREPLQYIIGHVDFHGLTIKVGPGVLIPRPETEIMVDEVIKTVHRNVLGVKGEKRSTFRILDLCTGSGCLALALAMAFPDADVFGTDVSEKAWEYATDNARINGVQNVTFLKGNLYEPVKGRTFDIIVSNPPYIKREDIPTLQPEIRGWEPLEALDGGEDGLWFYREILSRVSEYLVPGGFLVMELGQGFARDVLEKAKQSGFGSAALVKDYAGIERILILSLQ